MKAKFAVVHLLMLVGLLIGCSETNHDVFNDVPPPSAVSVDTVVQPLPSMTEKPSPLPLKQEEVAAAPVAPVLLAMVPVVVPIVSCGAAFFDLSTLVFGTPKFLSNQVLFAVGAVGMVCPDGGSIKGIKILKSANTLKKIQFRSFTHKNFRTNFESLIGRPVRPKYEVHHGIPARNEAQAAKYGINVHQPSHGIEIAEKYHDFITDNYRKDWDRFFDLPNLNQSKILIYEQFMLNKYGLKSGSYLDVIK